MTPIRTLTNHPRWWEHRGPWGTFKRVTTPRNLARRERYERDLTGKQRAKRGRAVPATARVRRG
jgi:predicted membrane chloride channel (bestrophin family)